MKKIAFVSRSKIMAQGLEASLAVKPELGLKLLPMIPPQNARTDTSVYEPDVIIIDVFKEMERETLFDLCRDLHISLPESRIILLLPEGDQWYHTLSVQAKQNKLTDDFVFYDNSMDYLLAKLAAL